MGDRVSGHGFQDTGLGRNNGIWVYWGRMGGGDKDGGGEGLGRNNGIWVYWGRISVVRGAILRAERA